MIPTVVTSRAARHGVCRRTFVSTMALALVAAGLTAPVAHAASPSAGSSPGHLTRMGSTLFFRADDGSSGVELWKSNGTSTGTKRVKNIRPGGSSDPEHLTVVGDTLYFAANDGTTGRELWKTDGTGSGTKRVKNVRSGSADSNPTEFVALGNTLYFTADDGIHGYELWKSNGTSSGTKQVKDINKQAP